MVQKLQAILKSSSIPINRSIQTAANSSFHNEQPLNLQIASLLKQKLFREALRAFDVFEKKSDCSLDANTYIGLVSACSSLRSVEYGRRIHRRALKSDLLPHVILENHIINMYGKCGSTVDAKVVFDEMPERNVVSWTALIAGYTLNSQNIEAIKFYIQMLEFGIQPDQFTFGSVIKAFSSLNSGEQLHAQVIKSEFGSHLIAQNALITMYSKYGRINEAWKVFDGIKLKDLISWSSIIAAFSKLGYELEALSCFKEMLSFGNYRPNEFIFGSVFSACGSLCRPVYGGQIHGLSVKYGYEGNPFAGCAVTDMYARCGFLDSAKTAFHSIRNPDLVAWNALIAGFAYGGDANGAVLFFSRMRHSGSKPDDITVRSLLCGFADQSTLSQGKQVHSFVIKIALDLDIPVCNTLFTMYANCSERTDAYKMFNGIRANADLVSWNCILTMCMHQNRTAEVFSLFRTMMEFHGRPDHITLTNVLGACGRFATLEMGEQAHSCAVKNGVESDIMVTNGLIDMYVKCGSLENGQKLFECTANPDVVSWSSLIVGYAQSGSGDEALNLFDEMKERGVKPNQVTFVGVLTACSHVGLVDKGMKLFTSMEEEYGVGFTKEHVSCVVDLLARAGRIHDAESLLNRVGFEPDVVMWKTLLAACRNRGDVEAGKRVAERVLRIDGSNSAAHVLLCDIHAGAGEWGSVAHLRGLMREKGVKKVRGESWIEAKNGVHVFSAKDGLHPEREKIFLMLEELWLQIVDAGFTPSLL